MRGDWKGSFGATFIQDGPHRKEDRHEAKGKIIAFGLWDLIEGNRRYMKWRPANPQAVLGWGILSGFFYASDFSNKPNLK